MDEPIVTDDKCLIMGGLTMITRKQHIGEWMQGQTQSKPHYFKPTADSGRKGSGGQGGQRRKTTKEWQSMLATAISEEQKKLLAAIASSELEITQ